MADKNKKNRDVQFSSKGGSILQQVTNSLNKHGEIRGNDKKETKNLRAMCPHHKINKKGKIKPMIYNDGNGTCTCEMCGRKFPTHLYSQDEMNDVVGNFRRMLDQTRYMVTAAELGKETTNYLAKLSVDTAHFPKTYTKVKKVVEKSDRTRKNKNKNKNRGSGSENYGSWR